MTAEEQEYIAGQLDELRGRLAREGLTAEAIAWTLLDQAVWALANCSEASLAPHSMRVRADLMEDGRYKRQQRPPLTVIHGDRT